MKVRAKLFGSATVLSIALLGGCTNGVFSTPPYLSVVISPRPVYVPVNGTVVLSGSVSNNLGTPQWTILDAGTSSAPGALTTVSGTPDAILYTAPAAPPIYSSAATGITQGTITVQASVAAPAQSTLPTAHDAITIFITSPSVTAGISPSSAAVARGAVQLFSGYAVGSVDNAVIYQVNGVTGGSVTNGTITTTGYYTAPSSLPVTGNTVTVSVLSHADLTKSASAVVTLQ